MTQSTVNKEPKWRHPRAELTTGYHPTVLLNKIPTESKGAIE